MAKKTSNVDGDQGGKSPATVKKQKVGDGKLVRKKLSRSSAEPESTPRKRKKVVASRGKLAGVSCTELLIVALRKAKNRECRTRELEKFVLGLGWKPNGKTPVQTISSILQREIKVKGAKSRFKRGKTRGTFQLTKLGMGL